MTLGRPVHWNTVNRQLEDGSRLCPPPPPPPPPRDRSGRKNQRLLPKTSSSGTERRRPIEPKGPLVVTIGVRSRDGADEVQYSTIRREWRSFCVLLSGPQSTTAPLDAGRCRGKRKKRPSGHVPVAGPAESGRKGGRTRWAFA